MATLYEIDSAILDCIDQETGEIIDSDKLDALHMERDKKLENVACWIKDLKAEAEAIKQEKLALAQRQKTAENKAERLKEWLAYALDGQKFKTPKCAVSFRNSVSVEVSDLELLVMYDDNLVTYQDPKPNKAAIKHVLDDGLTVPGCQLVHKQSVTIK